MFTTRSVLALVVLYLGFVHSWDIAVSAGERLMYYTSGTNTNTVHLISQNFTALVYDDIHDMMLYVDKQRNNDAVCGYNLTSKENKYFIERNGRNIHGLAFDPVKEIIFFSDTIEKSINWFSIKPGSNNNRYGNLLIKTDGWTPTDIAVDSCGGYIYWTSAKPGSPVQMERARFDGSERKVMYGRSLSIFSFAIDPKTQKIYYVDGSKIGETYTFYLNSANLNSENFTLAIETTLLSFDGHHSALNALTISKDYLYWMNSSENYQSVFQVPKNAGIREKEIFKLRKEGSFGIAANYKVYEQIQGLYNCTGLEQNNFAGLICVHGTKNIKESLCDCTTGYIGERCDISGGLP